MASFLSTLQKRKKQSTAWLIFIKILALSSRYVDTAATKIWVDASPEKMRSAEKKEESHF